MSFCHTCYLLLSQIAKETRRFEDKVYCYYYNYYLLNRFLGCNFRDYCLFPATCKKSPPVRIVSAANRLCNRVDILGELLLF